VSATAEAEGYRSGDADGSAPGALLIELEPASTLAGMVVDDATGAPIEDA
jgi:hypothetical protein